MNYTLPVFDPSFQLYISDDILYGCVFLAWFKFDKFGFKSVNLYLFDVYKNIKIIVKFFKKIGKISEIYLTEIPSCDNIQGKDW